MESPLLRIRLLGALDLRRGDTSLPPMESARAESLLAYLLLHQDAPQPRQHLAFLLWPDSTESQARTNLRHLLHILRRALPEPDQYLDVTPRTLQWRANASYWLDVAAFTNALSRAEQDHADNSLTAMREAVELYTGDLLEGRYDEWLLGERERLRTRYLETLARLTTLLEAKEDLAGAIHYADLLLRHDPLREETYRLLMQLHAASGDRARALRVYHVCAATLERELGVDPADETRDAYEALLPLDQQPEDLKLSKGRLGGPPLVGRQPEWSRLTRLWRDTEGGRAHFVLITGEPGIGKTRLIEEFRWWCVHRGAVAADAHSYAAEGALAYGPVVSWLRSEGLRTRLGRLDPARLTDLARLLPELLTAVPNLPRPLPLPEDDQRQRLFDAVAYALRAQGTPLLLVADDLHWGDRETMQLIHYLLRVDPDARLLVAATARHEDIHHGHPLNDLRAGLHALDRCTEIQLERLTRAETAALAEQMSGHPVEESHLDRLYDETEGSPLFVVETLRAGWQGGHDERRWLSPRVQAAIQARLDQLSEPARELVGLAATIGRAFTTDVLADAAEADADTLVRGLDELWQRRIIREQGADAYDFSHDKIREVAYLDLSPARRRQAHVRVAQALEQRHSHDPGPVSGQLAAHFERAGLTDQAISWYRRAAEAALQLHASIEAIRLLDRALVLLRTLPATSERLTQEFAMLAALATPLGWVEGWASDRLATVQQRALDLEQTLGVDPAPPLLRSLAIASLARRDFAGARLLGERLSTCGEHDTDDVLLVEADYVLGIAAFWQGELDAARRHFEAAVDRYRPEHRRAHLIRYSHDPKVICLSRLGNTLWFLGRPEAATRTRDAALALADEIGHPYSRSTALVFAALLALAMRDWEPLRAYMVMLAAGRAEDHSRPIQLGLELIGAYVDVLDKRDETGIRRIQHILNDAHESEQTPGMRAILVWLLLDACAMAGDARTGLAAADRALAAGGDDRLWAAETHRLRAEFLAALGSTPNEIEAEIGRALTVARGQGAKMLELRAAVSLLRHRLKHGDDQGAHHARSRLAAIVKGIPEGRDSHDLREAVTLLGRSRNANPLS